MTDIEEIEEINIIVNSNKKALKKVVFWAHNNEFNTYTLPPGKYFIGNMDDIELNYLSTSEDEHYDSKLTENEYGYYYSNTGEHFILTTLISDKIKFSNGLCVYGDYFGIASASLASHLANDSKYEMNFFVFKNPIEVNIINEEGGFTIKSGYFVMNEIIDDDDESDDDDETDDDMIEDTDSDFD